MTRISKNPDAESQTFAISPPNIREMIAPIIGMSPLLVCRFSQKSIEQMVAKQTKGTQAKKGAARAARDFGADFQGARHIAEDGWDGIHAGAFRNAMISACRLVGFKMTIAKLSVFITPDGFDRVDGVPLVRILGGEPERNLMHTRNATGVVDLRVRPMWRAWTMNVRVSFDADQFRIPDVLNLLARAGAQVGIGEGRPDSRTSAGMGMGLFRLATDKEGA